MISFKKYSRFAQLLGFLGWMLLPAAPAAWAANSLVTSTLTLASTFECISVEAKYTGDDNASATALVEYKAASSSTWLPAYTPYIDRRTTVNSNSNSAHVNEARVSIVGLQSNTSYNVRITWTDADGVSGTNPVTGTVSTLNTAPTTAVRTVNVANDTQLAAALSSHQAGDDIILAAGTYAARTISVSGNSGAWTRIRALTAGTVTLAGGSSISGSYLWLQNITVSGAAVSLDITSTAHHVMLKGCSFPNVSTSGASYGNSGVKIEAGAYHVYVLSSTFTCSGRAYADGAFGVYVKATPSATGTFIIADSTFSGTFRDAISNEANSWGNGFNANCDIARNTITDSLDDAIELDGDGRNVRVWGNTLVRVTGDSTGSLLSASGINLGPTYIFRNILRATTGIVAVKRGNGDPGPIWFFHNTISVSGSGSDCFSDIGGDPKSELTTYLNNFINAGRYAIYRGGRSNTHDYNYYSSANGMTAIANEWNTSTTYYTLANFQSGTSQEAHGLSGSATTGTDGSITTGNAAIDKGVSLSNFNDSTSAWPSSGAPDIGANEFSSSVAPSNATTNITPSS